jgi:hypothetical protein
MPAAVVLCVGVCVQNASSAAAPANATAQTDSKPITVVGCLVQGLPDGAERRAADTTAGVEGFFLRTATVKIPVGSTVAVGAPGTSSTATPVGTPTDPSFYRISRLSAEQLRPHVGHRVEIQGQLTDNMPGTESSRATTTQDKEGRATTTVERRIAIAGVLHATTLKMVSVDCDK